MKLKWMLSKHLGKTDVYSVLFECISVYAFAYHIGKIFWDFGTCALLLFANALQVTAH